MATKPVTSGAEKIAHHAADKWREGHFTSDSDSLAVEEPLEIRLAGRRFTLTMRTPGNDEELAAGFLLAEGFVANVAELGEIRRVRDAKGLEEPNAIDVILNVRAEGLRERLKRNFTISSSCGVCGKTSIDAITRRIAPI
ncbi:MAG TPA: formate dehydrogenase accessory sulfurtransferase FdhD, partial [Candidatus Binataceae bacterium]|nr:formate dehydrogenase accessory sulfurtransferase FdhD [Candidatus Binataceae bacterium]